MADIGSQKKQPFGIKESMSMQYLSRFLAIALLALALASCQSNQSIVNNIEEREANEIVVYLASKGIEAQKIEAPTGALGAEAATARYNIAVDAKEALEAMAALNRVGLPRKEGTSLLELFAKSGFMSSDREETIRYQAGLAEELKNTIRKIDGVLDADVQISFPPAEAAAAGGTTPPKITAAVYVKHQGILEDPNSHLEMKIKRLVSGSINGLDYNNVAVISDRSRLADIVLSPEGEPIGPKTLQQTYVSIWGVVMTKGSLMRFRSIFFFFIILLLLLLGALSWLIYKFYPHIQEVLFKKKTPPAEG